jgi:hypothetical protein
MKTNKKISAQELKTLQARNRAESALEIIARRQDAEFDAEIREIELRTEIRFNFESSNPYDLDQVA